MSSSDLRASRTRRERTQRVGAGPPGPAVGSEPEPPSAGCIERGRALLSFGGPRDVLARIVDGDPLDLRARIAAGLRRRCLLLDADRVHLRVLALCAREAPHYRGRPGLDEWLAGLVERALDELVGEEAERLSEPAPAHAPATGAFAQFATRLGLAPDEVRRACARFNRQPLESRMAFCEWVLERNRLDDLARKSRIGATELARRARQALLALLGAPIGASPASHAAGDSLSGARRPAAPTSNTGKDTHPALETAGGTGDGSGEPAL